MASDSMEALWDIMCDIDFGKSKNKVVRDMQALAFEVIVGDMKYVYLVDYNIYYTVRISLKNGFT